MQHDLGQATSILPVDAARFSGDIPVLIIGAGGCGLTAALSAHEHGADVLLVERDRSALGSTAMSTGLIPAAGTRFQKEKGIADSPALFAADMMAKTHGETDAVAVAALADEAAATVEWLADVCGAPLSLVDSYRYPGHSRMRMHGTPNRTGSELMGALHNAIAGAGIDIVTDAPVTHIFADGAGRVAGARITRDDGSTEDIGCGALILACGGFGGDKALRRFSVIPATRATRSAGGWRWARRPGISSPIRGMAASPMGAGSPSCGRISFWAAFRSTARDRASPTRTGAIPSRRSISSRSREASPGACSMSASTG
jgi:succinate dehydrogenase/fumarate reductase flavoprotein subunit